ncbi:hypothetical protein CDL15_Pgr028173 [Punica granatum]|uniref:Glutaminase n=1 Tax=Punica granatum TaxID=22663 RepID=A0A218XI91_PUNGR|nr:hypothetical protein CDL15_Pgr028173 [Punica granatum]
MVVGVLALQGSFNEHIAALRRLGVKGVEVRKPEQLQIYEQHESKRSLCSRLFPALRDFVKMRKPVWGTCAGLIFLADKVVGQKSGGQELIGGLDCTVHRNFFGSQLQSFEADLPVPNLASKEGGPETCRGVFIRAPAVLEAGPDVEVLAVYPVPPDSALIDQLVDSQEGEKKVIVAVKQGNLLATAFHPELTVDSRWHTFFLKMASEIEEGASNSIVTIEGSDMTLDQHQRIDLPIFQ